MKTDRWAAFVSVLFSPPIALLIGVVAALALWFALADAGLPSWVRLALSLMSLTAIPGLWFLLLPLLHLLPGAVRIQVPAGHDEWFARQVKVWEEHGEAFGAIVAEPVSSVQAIHRTERSGDLWVALLTLDLGEHGGCFALQYGFTTGGQRMDEPTPDFAASVADDVGTPYAVSTRAIDTSQAGGRCSIYVVPRPPAEARRLRLSVDRFFIYGRPDPVEGPWQFDVELPSGHIAA